LNTWTIVRTPKWPNLGVFAEFVSHDGLIYVTCATDYEEMRRPFYSFDPSKKTWKRLSDYLSRTTDHYLLSYKNSLVKIDFNQMEMYDVEDAVNNNCPIAYGVCLLKKSMLDKIDEIKDIREL